MSDTKLEAWIRMYEEEMTYARQHESLRSNSASLIAVATGAVLAFVASSKIPLDGRPELAVLGIFIVAINVLGWLIGRKHYERTRRHQAIARAYRKVISDNSGVGTQLVRHRKTAIGKHEDSAQFRVWATKWSVHKLWGVFHLIFVALGLFLLVYVCWLHWT